MQNEKLQINLGPGVNSASIEIREGKAKEVLPELAPIRTNLEGLLGAPAEFLRVRKLDETQIDPMRTHVLVDRDQSKITLVTQDNDPYNRGSITGSLHTSLKF